MAVSPLPDDDREALLGAVAGRYLHGDCYGMAVALHRRTGWPIVAAVDGDGRMVHAGVRRSDGLVSDVRGGVEPVRFVGPATRRPRSPRTAARRRRSLPGPDPGLRAEIG